MIERQLTLCANGRAALSGYAGGLQLEPQCYVILRRISGE